MPSIVETLEQEVFWFGQDGRPYLIESADQSCTCEYPYEGAPQAGHHPNCMLMTPVMEQSHRINVLHFLRRRAPQLQAHWVWFFMKNAAVVSDAIQAQILDNPDQWLMRRPFMQALVRAILREGSIDMELLELPAGFSVNSSGEVAKCNTSSQP